MTHPLRSRLRAALSAFLSPIPPEVQPQEVIRMVPWRQFPTAAATLLIYPASLSTDGEGLTGHHYRLIAPLMPSDWTPSRLAEELERAAEDLREGKGEVVDPGNGAAA